MSKRRKDRKMTRAQLADQELRLRERAARQEARAAEVRALYQMRREDAQLAQSEFDACAMLAMKAASKLFEISEQLKHVSNPREALMLIAAALHDQGALVSLRAAFVRSRNAVLSAYQFSTMFPRVDLAVSRIEGESK
jgi:hypothetical protein